jgi:transcriptional regulator with XRE-family HTH domain
MATTFGEYFATLRRERTDLSLREFCDLHGYDPGNLSKLERGKLAPPKAHEKLEEYAQALGLAEGSSEWVAFFDLAAASRGELPADVMEDQEIVDQLPVLFRTLRGEQVPEEQLKRLLDIIRRA